MFTIFLILVFAYNGYVGYRRGMYYQGILTIGFLGSLLITSLIYRLIIPIITLWVPYPSASPDSQFVFFSNEAGLNLDQAFYAGVSFIFVLIIVWLIVRVVLKGFDATKYLVMDEQVDHLVAILLALVVTTASLGLVLFVVSMVPVDGIQNLLDHSFLAKATAAYVPIFSDLYKMLFL